MHDNKAKATDVNMLSLRSVEWALSMVSEYQKAYASNKRPNMKDQWAALSKAVRGLGPAV